jgi:hypothetical protein
MERNIRENDFGWKPGLSEEFVLNYSKPFTKKVLAIKIRC